MYIAECAYRIGLATPAASPAAGATRTLPYRTATKYSYAVQCTHAVSERTERANRLQKADTAERRKVRTEDAERSTER